MWELETQIKKKKYLKIGPMSAKEVAEWFGITPQTYRLNRDKYWKILGEYAQYDCQMDGKVTIKAIYCSEYINPKCSNYEKVKAATLKYWNKDGIDKKINVAKKIEKSEEGKKLPLASSTLYNYVCKGSTEMWRTSAQPQKSK